MVYFPIFLSIILVVRNKSAYLEKELSKIIDCMSSVVNDYEIIIIDNASNDDSIAVLKTLSAESGLPNLQIYALTKEVDEDKASWVGLENALGDFVAVIDPLSDDIAFLPTMLEKAVCGYDLVFAKNQQTVHQNFAYRTSYAVFNWLYKYLNGIDLAKESAPYRLLSKRVVNFILQHKEPAVTYRHLPAVGGFARVNLSYRATPRVLHHKPLIQRICRGMQLLISITNAPMRLVTTFSLFGAGVNLVYSVYVVAIGFFKHDVAPGWISLSLQQSGMFFLISVVLLVLGEYILHIASLSNDSPAYHIGQEFTSVHLTKCNKLNIETAKPTATHVSDIA